jgi:hypothetical protein
MAKLDPAQKKKLLVFVALVVTAVLALWRVNRTVRDREAALSDGGNEQLRSGLERVARAPKKLALTMNPGTPGERQLRHVNAYIVGKVDVLALGQSDADHMSQTFFPENVHFYNAFLSNSYFAYQYEAFRDLVNAQGVPSLVLFDVRSGLILVAGVEPTWDPADAKTKENVWWAGPPFHYGKATAPPWYTEVDSLLSLQQTELTLQSLRAQVRPAAPGKDGAKRVTTSDGADVDTGAPFQVVAANAISSMHRWLFDGSRVYPGEHDGILVPRNQVRVEEASGDRHVNEERIARVDEYLRRMLESGTTIIMYSPPLQRRVFEDPKQAPSIRASGERLRAMAEKNGVDYCDLSLEADSVGCTASDFYDELHISRHCNQRIIKKLATDCAPRAGKKLRALLLPSILAD